MKNTRSKKVLLATTSIVLALLIGEAATRWLLPARYRWAPPPRRSGAQWVLSVPDPEIGWVLSPKSRTQHERIPASDGSSTRVVYSVNHGERLTSAQPRSGPMIVATGCSFTFGYHVNDEETWPWLLQERLPHYHIVNVAAGAYGTDQALQVAEREVSRFPGEVRTVVLGFADFHIDRNRCPQSWLGTICPASKPRFAQNGTGVQYKGQMRCWSLGSVADHIIDHSLLLSRVANLVADRLVYRIQQHDGARQLTAALITDFAGRFQSRGIRLVVVVLPYLADQSPQAKDDRAVIVGQLRAAGVPTLVMDIPRLPDGRMFPDGFTVGLHPNRQYNVLLADQLAQFLTALNMPETSGVDLGQLGH